MVEITGRTRIWGILADPIGHVKTPQMINAVAQERGVDGVMIPFHVAPSDLAALVKGLKGMKSLGGFVVTVPHKAAIVDLLDEVSPSARLIGAANCVRREADGLVELRVPLVWNGNATSEEAVIEEELARRNADPEYGYF